MATSHREILRSSSIVGGATVINIVIGLVRTKIAALLLGPVGLGLVGLFHNLMATASSLSALGLGNVGTRQVAEAEGRGDAQDKLIARRSFFWAALALSLLGAGVFWALRHEIARHILADTSYSAAVGWLSLGVALSVAATAQNALLTGLRRIGDVARVSVLSALFGTAVGIASLLWWGRDGLLVYVIASPVTNFLVGWYFTSKLPRIAGRARLSHLSRQWRVMVQLGIAFMLGSVAGYSGQLLVRILVQRHLGAVELGLFQAAWMISMTYIGVVLTAMSTDYYPRLAAAIHDHAAANRMVNDQAEVALLLAGPILLGMLGFAPWVIHILYSSEFVAAAELLRWQILGDVLKILLWPIGYILLAAGAGRRYAVSEALSMVCLVAITWLALPIFGLEGAGVAILAMYALYLPFICFMGHSCTGFRVDRRVLFSFFRLAAACVATMVLCRFNETLGMLLGLVLALVFAILSASRLEHALPAGLRRWLAWLPARN